MSASGGRLPARLGVVDDGAKGFADGVGLTRKFFAANGEDPLVLGRVLRERPTDILRELVVGARAEGGEDVAPGLLFAGGEEDTPLEVQRLGGEDLGVAKIGAVARQERLDFGPHGRGGVARESAQVGGAFFAAGIPEGGRENALMRDRQHAADGHPFVGAIRMLGENAGEKTDGERDAAGLLEVTGAAQLEDGGGETLGSGLLVIVFEPALSGAAGVRGDETDRGEAGDDEKT